MPINNYIKQGILKSLVGEKKGEEKSERENYLLFGKEIWLRL